MTCACGKKLGRDNRTGLCRPCFARKNTADPEIRAKQRAGLDGWLHSDAARRQSSRLMKARMRAHLAWCPDEHLAEYRRLRNSRKSAAIARQIIESRLTPFERQLQAVKNGAGITELRPILRAASSFSETGISTVYECG